MSLIRSCQQSLFRWFDANPESQGYADDDRSIDLLRVVPFLVLHVVAIYAIIQGLSLTAWLAAGLFFGLRMFAITAFYHRYLSHRSFKAPRLVVFLGSLLANSSGQRGPLWWAAHHRQHHRHSDEEPDVHSPKEGFWRSHMLWFLSRGAYRSRHELVPDLAKQPELRFIDRFDWLAPVGLALAMAGLGQALAWWAPSLGTSAWDLFAGGFVVSSIILVHVTCTINSLAHTWGSRPYATKDDSRNNLFLALLTFGEGWHNNHHHFPSSVRQGFLWWEVDLTWYILRGMQGLGLVSELRPVPQRVIDARKQSAEPQA